MFRCKSLIACIVISLGINLLIIKESIGGLGVSVSPGTWQIGDVIAGQTKNAGANYFTVSNTGTQFERIAIKVSTSTPGGMKPGTAPGKDTFVLKFGNTGSTYTAIASTDTTLVPWIIDGDYYQFDLQFQSPTDSNNPNVQQTITVLISAYADNPTALENRTLPARAPWYSSVICYIPQFTPEWVGTVGGFWCDKYEASQPNVSTAAQSRDTNPSLWPVAKDTDPGTVPGVSVANKPPWDYVSVPQALKACRNRGSGFHLITGYEWAAVAEYAKQVYGRQIPGNTANVAVPGDQDVDTAGTQAGTGDTTMTQGPGRPALEDYTGGANKQILTGSGPVVWSIDGAGLGPYDIGGNLWEWVSGLYMLDAGGVPVKYARAYPYVYDVTKSGNYGSCTKGTGNTVVLDVADDGTDLTSLSNNYWGTSGYYLRDSAESPYAFHQITGYDQTTKTLTLWTTPASGTYAYGIYKASTTVVDLDSWNRIVTIYNSDDTLKYYAIPATTTAGGSADYGIDGCWFGSNESVQRGGCWSSYGNLEDINSTASGGFALGVIWRAGSRALAQIGFRACK